VNVHDSEYSTFSFSRFLDPIAHFIAYTHNSLVTRLYIALADKSLQKSPVHAMFSHPMEMSDRLDHLVIEISFKILLSTNLCTVLGLRDENRKTGSPVFVLRPGTGKSSDGE
jgi:hypothetical protein